MKRKLFFITCIILVSVLTPLQGSALEYFEILNYNIDMVVNEDNSYDITENIEVEFSMERHGIYRDIPSSFYGNRALIKNIAVKGHQYKVSKDSSNVRIRIGSPDTYVNGKQVYTISYKYILGKDKYSEYDELYHNIIGTGWDTYIHNVNFNITMPKEFNAENINFTSGGYGSTENNNVSYTVEGNVIKGALTTGLAPYEALTIALPLPQGYYSKAKDLDLVKNMLKSIIYLSTALLLLLSFIKWKKYGKDKELFGPIQFYPPKNLTPAEIGYIIDGVVDNKDVTSLIIYWADKGFLKIVEPEVSDTLFGKIKKSLSRDKFTLVKLKDANSTMKRYEKDMFNDLFNIYGDGEVVTTSDLSKRFYKTVNSTKSDIERYYTGAKSLYTPESKRLKVIFHMLAIVPSFLILITMFMNDIHSIGSLFQAIIISFFSSVIINVPVLLIMKLLMGKQKLKSGFSIRPVLAILIALLPAILLTYNYVQQGSFVSLDALVMIVSSVTINFMAFIMLKRSEFSNSYAEQILGFKEFLLHAEKPKLEELIDENPDYFYSTLSYAMVLDVTQKWAKKFDSITMEPPKWHESSYRAYSAVRFTHALDNSFKIMSSSMTSRPSSKSGGGGSSMSGGFSGGGSGGGGGGSW